MCWRVLLGFKGVWNRHPGLSKMQNQVGQSDLHRKVSYELWRGDGAPMPIPEQSEAVLAGHGLPIAGRHARQPLRHTVKLVARLGEVGGVERVRRR